MGIKRLFSYMKENFEQRDLSYLSGKRLGIDGMNWLYQAFFSVCENIDSIHVPMVRKVEYRFKLLEKYNISFTVVIDGKNLVNKALALRRRKEKREYYQKQAEKYENEEDFGQIAVYEKYSQEVTPELIFFFIDYLKYKKFDYIVAPYEADSQLAYLLKTNKIDYICSEDSDFLAMSCFKLVRGIKREGNCEIFNDTIKTPKKINPTSWEMFSSLSERRRTMLCVMTGCDYIDNLRNVGFITLIKLFYKLRDINDKAFDDALLAFLKKRPLDVDIDEYLRDVKRYCISFTSQVVYNPDTKNLINAQPLKPCEAKIPDIDSYVGAKFDNVVKFIQGDLSFQEHKPRGPSDGDMSKFVGFVNFVPVDSEKRLNNLCQVPFGFENFNQPIIEPPVSRIKPTGRPFRKEIHSRNTSVTDKKTFNGSFITRSISRQRLSDEERTIFSKRVKIL